MIIRIVLGIIAKFFAHEILILLIQIIKLFKLNTIFIETIVDSGFAALVRSFVNTDCSLDLHIEYDDIL